MKPVLLCIHIPKTAGTSFRIIIEKSVPKHERLSLYTPEEKLDFINFPDKEKLKVIFGHYTYGERIDTYLNRDYKFLTFMRNPIDQVISHYYHFYNSRETTNPNRKNVIQPGQVASLKNFAKAPIASNLQTKYISGIINAKLTNHPKKVLELAKYHIENYFDFVGITEHYEESVEFLCNRYNWKPSYKKHLVGSRPKTKEISEETIEIIKDKNKLDIQLYKFALKKFSKKIKSTK